MVSFFILIYSIWECTVLFSMWQLSSPPLWLFFLRQRRCRSPTNNALLIKFLLSSHAEIFANDHRLSIQIGVKRAKMRMQGVHIPTELSFRISPVGGWVALLKLLEQARLGSPPSPPPPSSPMVFLVCWGEAEKGGRGGKRTQWCLSHPGSN